MPLLPQVNEQRQAAAPAPTDMNRPLSALQFFTNRLGQLFRQGGLGQAQSSKQSEPDVNRAVQGPSSVQIALMQRMGVKGRPFMDACKRRSLST
ncbi:hypothetical protein [Synechococcus sp. UW179A]|uniref:hypothetical protein n=1 Tax=Synechococcus sp. UW179A TaxID=2575510 RepID=UPI000E0FEBFB|nr:hypothetical protein [Synechococcus sp. UW179A]